MSSNPDKESIVAPPGTLAQGTEPRVGILEAGERLAMVNRRIDRLEHALAEIEGRLSSQSSETERLQSRIWQLEQRA